MCVCVSFPREKGQTWPGSPKRGPGFDQFRVEVGQFCAELDEFRPNLAQDRPELTYFCTCPGHRPTLARLRPELSQCRANSNRVRPKLAHNGPTSPICWPHFVELGLEFFRCWPDPTLAEFDQVRAMFGHVRPNCRATLIDFDRMWADFGQTWARVDQRTTKVGPEFDRVRPNCDRNLGLQCAEYCTTWCTDAKGTP